MKKAFFSSTSENGRERMRVENEKSEDLQTVKIQLEMKFIEFRKLRELLITSKSSFTK